MNLHPNVNTSAAIGLYLLSHGRIPLLWGVAITAADVLLLLAMQRFGIRKMEAFIVVLVATIGLCFVVELFLSKPSLTGIASGFVPRTIPPLRPKKSSK